MDPQSPRNMAEPSRVGAFWPKGDLVFTAVKK
jgi:hypothetical protein